MSASTVHRASTGHRAFPGHRASTALRACAGLRARAAALIRRVPRAAWLCALVALANCLAWSLITPPFQVPDENAHYAYVAQVAERGTVPRQILPEGLLSPAEDGTLGALDFYEIVGDPHNPAPFSTLQQQTIEQVLSFAEQSSASAEEVSATTEQTSASAQQIAASAGELASTAESLQGVVRQFKLS